MSSAALARELAGVFVLMSAASLTLEFLFFVTRFVIDWRGPRKRCPFCGCEADSGWAGVEGDPPLLPPRAGPDRHG